MIRLTSLVLATALVGAAVPAFAAQEGLVNVNVSNVANDIAKNLSIDVSKIPVTVQVPVGIAANVCGVDANVLASQKKGTDTASCDAKSTNQALEQAIKKQAM